MSQKDALTLYTIVVSYPLVYNDISPGRSVTQKLSSGMQENESFPFLNYT